MKKYQVFISSTYKDLIEERMAVTQCLLENDCIPVGMEQFAASNMSQMEYIKMMLDDCDYYILILAGRYGTVDTDGIGFTEKEYDYAIKKGIPVMSFVIRDPKTLTNEKCEETEKGRKKLAAFREKVSTGKMVKYYTNSGTLQAAVATSLNRCIRDFPAVGWVRGDNTPNYGMDKDVYEKILGYCRDHGIRQIKNTTLSNEKVVEKVENAKEIFILVTTGAKLIPLLREEALPRALASGCKIHVLTPEKDSKYYSDVASIEKPNNKKEIDRFNTEHDYILTELDQAWKDAAKMNRDMENSSIDWYCSHTLLRQTILIVRYEDNRAWSWTSLTMPPRRTAHGTPSIEIEGSLDDNKLIRILWDHCTAIMELSKREGTWKRLKPEKMD